MSDTVRNWSSTAGPPKRSRRRRGFFRWIVLALVPLFFLWAWRVSRDTYEVASLVPRDQAYEVYLNNPLEQRLRLAESELWHLAPPGFEVSEIRAQLSADIGVPEWVINNFAPGACLVTGNEIETFADALLVTRMTRVGCLIEKGRGFVSGVTVDPAGGLNLCHLSDAGLWYAVRGRVLLLSRERAALIHALTLTPDDAQTADALDAGFARAREALVFARMSWPESETGPGAWIAEAEATLRLSPEGGELRGRVLPAPIFREALAPLLAEAKPAELSAPLDGLVSVSADFGMGLGTFWEHVEEIAGMPGMLNTAVAAIAGLDGEDPAAFAEVARPFLSDAGPSIRMALVGVDPLAMVPVPELAVAASGNATQLYEQFAAVPPPPANARPEMAWPRYDAERRELYIPMIGGPSIEPTFGVWDNGLLFSTSRTRAEALLAAVPPQGSPGTGNLYVTLRPAPIVDALAQLGHEFAVMNTLRGHTSESFDASMAPWRTWAQIIRRVSLLASHAGDGAIDATVKILLANTQ